MTYSNARTQKSEMKLLRAQFAQKDGLSFADVLSADTVRQALEQEKVDWRDCIYTPLLTLWAFLSQIISADNSCRAAVARVLAWLISQGAPTCSADTSPYCKARKRLPEKLFQRLTHETGRKLHQQLPEDWRWKGRRVKIVDGTSVVLPDTPENQAEYPQPSSQKEGLGFPLMRVVVVFCLACGTVLDAALGRWEGKQTGENTLLRTLGFDPEDIVLADRYFGGFCDLCWWQKRRVDMVVRLNKLRRCDMRRGTRLGRDDHLVFWPKPRHRPRWMDLETFIKLPKKLQMREVRVHINQPGFRCKEVVVATTLLDHEKYTADDIAQLYRARWNAELDLRSLKTTLDMDRLRCKKPDMVRKELWGHLLVYNLIRTVMAQAAKAHDVQPRTISFKGTLQTMTAFASSLFSTTGEEVNEQYKSLLGAVVQHAVGDRPNRIEPRCQKRRPKEYPFLTKPRATVRKRLLKGT